ncbi:hypothetical protein [Aminipila terrae]|uniref:CDP-Glycerol:Poly(Glycerophosphate) glycerophosphotransferase n=1 Tax=Aminipila terrae TaxID=2697030 RepID=A0A6P1MBI0_9FIRM|nr:hypothetical protein [Aminipila terrae]QHI72059.1 hypothetical protein Ami3637_06295 [Aminipila terrae]
MNFTRWIYFERLVSNIKKTPHRKLNRNLGLICDEIEFQIKRVEKRADGSIWGITNGDKIYIDFMHRLKKLLIDPKMQELDKILLSAKNDSQEKFRILFQAQDIPVWPSLSSVYEAIINDSRFITDMIDFPEKFDAQFKFVDVYRTYKKMGYDITRNEKYDLCKSSPDFTITNKPYGGGTIVPPNFYILETRKVVERNIYCPYAFFDLENNHSSIYNGHHMPICYFAWLWVGYSEKFKKDAQQFAYNTGKNMVVFGHPKFDNLFKGLESVDSDAYNVFKEKINGRKVLLYNSHHTVWRDESSCGAFMEYYKAIFHYFKNHPNVILLWRPHPYLFTTLVNRGILNENELTSLIGEVDKIENIILDNTDNYLTSFALSDGLISDGGPSMTFEYVATGKPVYYTVRKNCYVMPKDSIAECYYWINTPSEVEHNLELFFQGKDPFKEERMKKAVYHLGIVDGKCGNRIKEYIFNKTIEEEQERADYVF